MISATAGWLVVEKKERDDGGDGGSESKIYVEPFSLHSCAHCCFFNTTKKGRKGCEKNV